MNVARVQTFLLSLPHVVQTEQFAGLVYWVGDKALGGKMFAMLDLGDAAASPIWFPTAPERFHELLESDGFSPAPYLARIHWIAAEHWGVLRDRAWEDELRSAHALTLAKLSLKTRKMLALPRAQQRRLIVERRRELAARKLRKREAL